MTWWQGKSRGFSQRVYQNFKNPKEEDGAAGFGVIQLGLTGYHRALGR